MAIDSTVGYDTYPNLIGPVRHAVAVTPSDTVELAPWCRGIYVGVGGNLKVTTVDGDAVTFTGVLAGVMYPIRAKLVWSTGTTATTMLACS